MIDDLVAGWKEIVAAEEAYCEAEDQYTGDASEKFASDEVENAIGSTGDAYKMPLIAQAVNVLASRCKVRRVSSPQQQEITEWIEKVWKANQLAVYYPELIKDTCKLGDYYVMIWDLWSQDETPEDPATDAESDLEEVGIEWTIHSPKRVRVFYDPENERRKSYALKRWPHRIEGDDREYWRVDLYYPDHIEHWVSVQGQAPDKPEGWEESAPDTPNPHDAIPFFHHRTGLLYGTSVMKPGYGAQNAFTKMTISQLTTSEAQAFGERVALTDPDAVLDSNLDSPDFPEDDESLSSAADGPLRTRGGQRTNLRGGPGTWKILDGIKSVEQMDQADPDVFMGPGEFYLNMLSITTQTPLSSLLPRVQPESGDAKRIAETPLIERAKDLQTVFAATIEESWRFALKIAKKNHRVPLHVSWTPAYAATSVHEWQAVNEQIRAGVPQDVALVDAGYELEQVQGWLDPKPEQRTLDSRIEVVKDLMAGFQAAGLAGVLGVTMGASGAMGTPSGPVYEGLVQLFEQATQQEAIAG
jgi:hypothetical protein